MMKLYGSAPCRERARAASVRRLPSASAATPAMAGVMPREVFDEQGDGSDTGVVLPMNGGMT